MSVARINIARSLSRLSLVHLCALASFALADCNYTAGPSGVTDCVLFSPAYDDHQYATCLTSAFVVQKSRGERSCSHSSPSVGYCQSPCMADRHGRSSGPVSDDCRCTAGKPIPQSTLPANCTSPVGADCSWYSQCLAVQYPCGGQAGYALGYGDAFCRFYDKRLSKFSARGIAWLDASRRCLQVQLTPVLYASNAPYSCAEVKQIAFDTHVDCYLRPYEGLSFCDLSLWDKWEVFVTVKSGFLYKFAEMIKGLVSVMKGCLLMMLDEKVG